MIPIAAFETVVRYSSIVLLVVFTVAFICGLVWNITAQDYSNVKVNLKQQKTSCVVERKPSPANSSSGKKKSNKKKERKDSQTSDISDTSSKKEVTFAKTIDNGDVKKKRPTAIESNPPSILKPSKAENVTEAKSPKKSNAVRRRKNAKKSA